MRMSNRIAVVTGAGSGIGRASAHLFASEGATVVCVDRHASAAGATVEEIRAEGGTAEAVEADLTDEAQAIAMSERARAISGHVDVVLACAGIAGPGSVEGTGLGDWNEVISVDLTAKWLSFKHLLPAMKGRGRGSIVILSSTGAFMGRPGIFPYSAAKGGCVSMARQAAVELGPHGVRVNALAPGVTPTPLVTASFPGGGDVAAEDALAQALEIAVAKVPLGRLGTPEDIARAALFLASDESSWVTGQTLIVDGGATAQ